MKRLKLYILFLLVSFSFLAFAVTLPTYSFFGANELYEENQDMVEITAGTKIGGINMLLESNNESWGAICTGQFKEQGECQDCCAASWAKTDYEDADEVLFNTCMKMCGGGPSLPLGSVFVFLPFALIYAGIKKYKSNN